MTAIQEAVPAAAGAAQSRGGEVSNAAAAAGKRVRARKHSGASQNSWQSKLRPYLFIAPAGHSLRRLHLLLHRLHRGHILHRLGRHLQ